MQLCCPPCPCCSLSVTERSTSRREFYPAMEALLRKERKGDKAGKGAQHLHLLALPSPIWKALAPSVAASKETRLLEAARDTRYWRRECSDQLAAHLRRHRIKHNLGNKPGQIWASAQLSRKGVLTQHPGELLSEAQRPAAHTALLSSVLPRVPAQQDSGRLGQGCTSMGNLLSTIYPGAGFAVSRLERLNINSFFTKVSNFYLCQKLGEREM